MLSAMLILAPIVVIELSHIMSAAVKCMWVLSQASYYLDNNTLGPFNTSGAADVWSTWAA